MAHLLKQSLPPTLLAVAALAFSLSSATTTSAAPRALTPSARAHHATIPTPTFTVFRGGETAGFNADVQPFGITAGPDGNVWFTEFTGGSTQPGLGKITPAGQVSNYPTGAPGLSQPYSIVTGGDGNLWFTDIAAKAIGRMTPSGKVTMFSAGLSADDTPAGLTRAADGSVWFVSNNPGPYVGRVDANGTITEVAHMHTDVRVADPSLAQDAAGTFWFDMADHARHEFAVGVTPKGRTTRQELPLEYSFNPCCVTSSSQSFSTAPDGSVWFANLTYELPRTGVHLLGHVTDEKAKAVRNPVQFISSLAQGPFGELWYAAQDPFFAAPGLGYIDGSTGNFTTFTMPRAINPISLAYGPDGNLWMSGYDGKTGLIIMGTP